MRVNTKVIVSIETGEILARESFDYTGPVARAFSLGAGGSGGNSNQQSQSQQSSASNTGTAFNPDFLNQAFNYFGKTDTAPLTDRVTKLTAQRAALKNSGVQEGDSRLTAIDQNISQVNDALKTASTKDATYNPIFTPGTFTGGNYTPVPGGSFNQIEQNLYGGEQSKLKQAYDTAQAQQREQLAQSGALNSPSQYLEGSARSSLDRTYIQNLQQAARDASTQRIGLQQQEAARQTAYDVGQGAARTAFDTGEAGRATQFSQDVQQKLLETLYQKLMLALQSGQFSSSASQGTSRGSGSSIQGSGQAKVGVLE